MCKLYLVRFPDDEFINVNEIEVLTPFRTTASWGTTINLKSKHTKIIKDKTPEEVIAFIRTNTADIFSIS